MWSVLCLVVCWSFVLGAEFRECVNVPKVVEDRRNDTSRLKVGTFNAEFLFLKGLARLKCPGEDCAWKDEKMAMEHVRAVARVIVNSGADIMQLSEVEDCDALQALVDEIKLLGDDSYRPYVVKGLDTFTGQNVGFITKIDPIVQVQRSEERVEYPVSETSCGDFGGKVKSKGVSKHFYTKFQVPGFDYNITMVGAHLLARPDDTKRCFQRESQASVLANIVKLAVAQNDDVVVLGDLNDFSDVVPDIKGSRPISSVMKILRNAGNGLRNAALKAPQELRYSNWWDHDPKDCKMQIPNDVSMIDQMLLSPRLFAQTTKTHFGNDYFTPNCGTLYSDHFPIVSTIVAGSKNPPIDDPPTPIPTIAPSIIPTPAPSALPPATCAINSCKYVKDSPCQCNEACKKYNDCCADYDEVCDGKGRDPFVECKAVPKLPEDRRVNKEHLSIATFNAEFLFMKGLSKLKCPGSDCDWKDDAMAQKHIDAVASMILKMNVDIIQLTEVEDCDALAALVTSLAAMGDTTYKQYLVRGKDLFTGQNVALLTRVDPIADMQRSEETIEYPVPNTSCGVYDGKPSKSKGVSKHFYTRFAVDGFAKPITMVGLHFLARPDDVKRCFQREAQATVIGNIVQKATKRGDHVVVLGDFNDFSESVADIKGSAPISSTLKIIRTAGNGLVNIASKVAQKQRYTNWWDHAPKDCIVTIPNEVSMLDHILLSPDLYELAKDTAFGHDLFQQSCDTLHSDHYPIYTSITSPGKRGSDSIWTKFWKWLRGIGSWFRKWFDSLFK